MFLEGLTWQYIFFAKCRSLFGSNTVPAKMRRKVHAMETCCTAEKTKRRGTKWHHRACAWGAERETSQEQEKRQSSGRLPIACAKISVIMAIPEGSFSFGEREDTSQKWASQVNPRLSYRSTNSELWRRELAQCFTFRLLVQTSYLLTCIIYTVNWTLIMTFNDRKL